MAHPLERESALMPIVAELRAQGRDATAAAIECAALIQTYEHAAEQMVPGPGRDDVLRSRDRSVEYLRTYLHLS